MIAGGLDLSMTSAGIAKLRDGRPVLLESVGHKGSGATSWVNRINRIVSQSRAITRVLGRDCDLVAVEAPLTFAGGPNNGDAFDRYAVFIGVCSQLMSWKTPFVVINNQTRVKWVTGKAFSPKSPLTQAEKKRAVLDAVRATWAPWAAHIRNDDVADALAMAEIAARGLGEELPFPIERRQVAALEGMAWPEGVGR